jgi:transposase
MFEIDQTLQPVLFATSPRDFLPNDSDVWVYIDLFKELDLSFFIDDYSEHGRKAKDPELVLRVIFYGLTHRASSIRALTEACRNDLRFIVLSGNQRPDRRTFDRFIRRHSARMEDLFTQVIELASKAGMISLGSLALDGSRFKAKANRRKGMQYGKMGRAIEHIKDDLKALERSLDEAIDRADPESESRISKDLLDKNRRLEKIRAAKSKLEEEFKTRRCRNSEGDLNKTTKCLHDIEAQAMAGKGEGFNFGYNAQIVVDSENQIIVAGDIHDHATDTGALPTILTQVENQFGQGCLKDVGIMADFGYRSADNITEICSRGAEPLIPHQSDSKKDLETHLSEQLSYDEKTGRFSCLAGKNLGATATSKGGVESIQIRTYQDQCNGCPFIPTCKMWKENKLRRSVLIPSRKNFLNFQRSIQQSRTEEFSERYRKRKAIVEPVFGNIKNKGLKIHVTGLKSVRRWWKLVCIAHNIEKIVRKRLEKTLEPIFSSLVSSVACLIC